MSNVGTLIAYQKRLQSEANTILSKNKKLLSVKIEYKKISAKPTIEKCQISASRALEIAS